MITRPLLSAILVLVTTIELPAATLAFTLDLKRKGGTATGSFVDAPLPSFLLSAQGQSFHIQPSGLTVGGLGWEFLLDENGDTPLLPEPTLVIDETTTFSSGGRVRIEENGLALSANRFEPDPVHFLVGRIGDDYFAFEVALWNPGNERLRIYDDVRELDVLNATAETVPEPAPALLGVLGLTLLVLRRQRGSGFV